MINNSKWHFCIIEIQNTADKYCMTYHKNDLYLIFHSLFIQGEGDHIFIGSPLDLWIFSIKIGRFCLKSLSLLRSTGARRARILRTCGGAASGGQGQKRSMTGTMGLRKVSARVKSLLQLSLCRYLEVIQHSTTCAARMLRWFWLVRVSSAPSIDVTDRTLKPLLPRCRPARVGLTSLEHVMPLSCMTWVRSSTRECMSHW